jgi:hypothetical protein
MEKNLSYSSFVIKSLPSIWIFLSSFFRRSWIIANWRINICVHRWHRNRIRNQRFKFMINRLHIFLNKLIIFFGSAKIVLIKQFNKFRNIDIRKFLFNNVDTLLQFFLIWISILFLNRVIFICYS